VSAALPTTGGVCPMSVCRGMSAALPSTIAVRVAYSDLDSERDLSVAVSTDCAGHALDYSVA
jgi:hypothetical protein